MKQLQNNFTTPEQSKRLLELGVPADSADCYWHPKERRNNKSRGYWSRPIILEDGHTVGYEQSYSAYFDLLPCWSVGRLIEIYNICLPEKPYPYYPRFGKYENMIGIMVDAFVFTQGELNFSKLEE